MRSHDLRRGRWTALAVVGLLLLTSTGDAAEEPGRFQRDVEPLLTALCVDCHGPEDAQGQLRLDFRSTALQGGFSGPAVVPGQPEASVLIERIKSEDPELRMPLDGEPLSAPQIAAIESWIRQGAVWPESASAGAPPEPHWAYVSPVRPTTPTVQQTDWVRNPIDAFVLARLEREELKPAAPASKEQLLRRVSLDLIGLPPTLAELDAFLRDSSEDAYEKVVDRLLASPHYGERWAQPWLDGARYADSNGFTNDRRRTIWPYRDWVVQAINDDMPFDQFTIEQLAGDLLPDATIEQRTATGLHRNTRYNDETGVDRDEGRWNALVDRVATTASVWLGTTLACAQCHNHKHDPFSQKDFYALLAFFEPTDYTKIGEGFETELIEPVLDPAPPEVQAKRRELLAAAEAIESQLDRQSPGDNGSDSDDVRDQLEARRQELRDEVDAISREYPTTLVLEDRPTEQPPTTELRIRGSYLAKGAAVQAATPAVLHPLPADAPLNRLTLARWIVAPENPLTARVIVNRDWAQFFGRGLVATEGDFGTRGAKPTHPELLDYLATEFIQLGWSRKSLHRQIVTSAAYRQSSLADSAKWKQDPENRLLARGPRFRLDAEVIRDTTLAISGLLSRQLGGPPVFPPQPELSALKDHGDFDWDESEGADRYRRALYIFWRRTALYPPLKNFDAPTRDTCTVGRQRSNTPLQSLTLLNDATAAEAAGGLVRRIVTEAPTADVAGRAAFAFRLCTARFPGEDELDAITATYERSLRLMQDDAESTARIANEHPHSGEPTEFAAWFLVAQSLLNLDETLSKE